MKESLEGFKQFLRVVIVAVIPVAIDALSRDTIDARSALIAGAIAVLMGVDKFLHESGVRTPLDMKNIK